MTKLSCIYCLYNTTRLVALLLFFLLISINTFSQKEYSRWYFGNSAGINFNTTPPSALTDGVMSAMEGCSSICDENGNLLFYTDGDTIYNRFHKSMKNGVFASGVSRISRESSYQSSLVLPVPNKPNLFYILTTDANESLRTDSGYLRYSIVDMTGDGGLGEMTQRNKPLIKQVREHFAVGSHANGIDYWFCATSHNDSFFYTLRTINGVMSTAVKQHRIIDSTFLYSILKFAPNSRIIYLPSERKRNGWDSQYRLNLSKFNNASGSLYNGIKVTLPINVVPLRQEFSSDSRFLYVDEISRIGNYNELVQYDLSVWHPDSVSQSRFVIAKYLKDSASWSYGLQLGPDGKIYIFHRHTSSYKKRLWVINQPNKKGKDCDIDIAKGLYLGGRTTIYGAPYYPSFLLSSLSVSLPSDTALCIGDTLTIKAQSNGTHFLWITGDTTKSISISKSGTYWVKAISQSDTAIDNIIVSFKEKFKVYLGNDTTFCNQFSHLLDAGIGAKKYMWNTGDTTVTKLVDQPGIYAVTVRDSNNCNSGDTISIFQQKLQAPPISVEYDSITCSYVKLSIPIQDSGVRTKWSTSDTTYNIKVFNKGLYFVEVSTIFCDKNSSINVDELSMPEVDLGSDSSLCDNQSIILRTNTTGNYKWSTGETTSAITVYTPSTYSLVVSRNGCMATDSIVVKDRCNDWYYIPNAFTPNHDGLNNVFSVVSGEKVSAKMWIFNRWGEKIFYGEGGRANWDGTYKGETCQEGVYMYIIQIIIPTKNGFEKKNLKGNVTLLR